MGSNHRVGQRCPRALILIFALVSAAVPGHGRAGGPRRARRTSRQGQEFPDLADHVHHVVGVKLIALGSFPESPEDEEVYWGPGLIYELTVIPHWLEIELAGAALFKREGAKLPVDVLLKKPFRLSRSVDLFVGGGPMMNISVEENEASVHWGVIGSLGGFLWLWSTGGILLEVDYAYLDENRGAHEIEAACGVAVRFR